MTAKTFEDFMGGDDRPKFYAVQLNNVLAQKDIPACIKIVAKTIIDKHYYNLADFLKEISSFDLTALLAFITSVLAAFEAGQLTEETAVSYKNAVICSLVLGQGEGMMVSTDKEAHLFLLRTRSCLLVEYLIRTHNLTIDRTKLSFDTSETDLIKLADDVSAQMNKKYGDKSNINKKPDESK